MDKAPLPVLPMWARRTVTERLAIKMTMGQERRAFVVVEQ